MKKFLLLLVFLPLLSFSQPNIEIGGTYCELNHFKFRPSLEAIIDETEYFEGKIGVEVTEYDLLSLKISGIFKYEISRNLVPYIGFHTNILGYDDIYQHFMPNISSGLIFNNLKVFTTLNWHSKQVPLGILPTAKGTFGIIYRLN